MPTTGDDGNGTDEVVRHLKRALDAEETGEVDYHLRQALQSLDNRE